MKIKPLFDNIVLKIAEENEVTASGIVLPSTVDKEKPESGEVVAIGAGRVLDNGQKQEMSLKVGDKVVFKKYSPDEVKVDGEDYLVVKESDVIAIIE